MNFELSNMPLIRYLLLFASLLSIAITKKYESVFLSDKQHVEFQKELTIHGIIPEVVHQAPKRIVYLGYNNGNYSVYPGDKLAVGRPFEISEAPFNTSWGANSEDLYTLVLFDFDSPLRSAPVLRSFIHWMVGNIPGSGVMMAKTFFEYFPPRARADTGVHRYVMLVWRHGNIVEFKEPYRNETNEDDRAYFNHTAFQMKYKLKPPIALTYFECEWDYTIPTAETRKLHDYEDETITP